jgi:hypothetical protein
MRGSSRAKGLLRGTEGYWSGTLIIKPFPNPVVSGFVVRQACPELAEVAHHEREMMLTMG